MLKTLKLIGAATLAAFALPVAAGSGALGNTGGSGFEPAAGEAGWQLVQPEYAWVNGSFKLIRGASPAVVAKAAPATQAIGGFEYASGDAGWQLSQHKYDFTKGGLVMSDQCDHAIRSVKAATPAEIESARRLSPGA